MVSVKTAAQQTVTRIEMKIVKKTAKYTEVENLIRTAAKIMQVSRKKRFKQP